MTPKRIVGAALMAAALFVVCSGSGAGEAAITKDSTFDFETLWKLLALAVLVVGQHLLLSSRVSTLAIAQAAEKTAREAHEKSVLAHPTGLMTILACDGRVAGCQRALAAELRAEDGRMARIEDAFAQINTSLLTLAREKG